MVIGTFTSLWLQWRSQTSEGLKVSVDVGELESACYLKHLPVPTEINKSLLCPYSLFILGRMIAWLSLSRMENRSQVQLASFREKLGQIFRQLCAELVGIYHLQLKEGIDL